MQDEPTFSLQDALELTLLHHPQLQIQREQVEVERGILRQAAGQFDLQMVGDGSHGHTYRPLTAYETFLYNQYGVFDSAAVTSTSQLTFGVQKQLRNGIILSPNLQAARITDNLANLEGINQGSIQFAVTLPLLRGRGRSVVDAQEMSAAKQLNASVAEVNETITALLAVTANSYWNLVSAEKYLSVLREAEQRAITLVENTQALIDADRLARAEINVAKANLAQRLANRMEGEKNVIEAKAQLAVDMGLDAAQMSHFPQASSDFPPLIDPESVPYTAEALKAYTALAISRKPELQALRQREEASQILAKAAKNGLKPQLDFRVGVGVAGLDEGKGFNEFLFSPAHSGRGADLTGGVTYRFPPARDAARGALQVANAVTHQTNLQYKDTERRTVATIAPALYGVRNEARQLRLTRESVQFYRNAVEAEKSKLQVGASSVLNSLQMQDRLIFALQNEIQAGLEFAQSLVRMRQATSTIVTTFGQGGSVDASVFSSLPAAPIATSGVVPAP